MHLITGYVGAATRKEVTIQNVWQYAWAGFMIGVHVVATPIHCPFTTSEPHMLGNGPDSTNTLLEMLKMNPNRLSAMWQDICLPKDNIFLVGHVICGNTDDASGGYSHFFLTQFSCLQVKTYMKGFPRWVGTRQMDASGWLTICHPKQWLTKNVDSWTDFCFLFTLD